MLEYIYTLLQKKHPTSIEWCDNLSILDESITIDLNVINANLKRFETNIDLLYDRLQTADETQFSGKNFVHKMKPFYDDACKQLSTFNDSVKRLNKDLKQLGEWFDVEDGDNLEFLKQINTFRKTYKGIGARLDKRAKDKERKAKREAKLAKMGKKGRKKKRPKYMDDGQTFTAKGDKSGLKSPVKGGVPIPGFGRQASIRKAAQKRKALNLDESGNLVAARSGSMMVPSDARARGPSLSINRQPSVSVNRGGLSSQLWKFAASVDNKVKV